MAAVVKALRDNNTCLRAKWYGWRDVWAVVGCETTTTSRQRLETQRRHALTQRTQQGFQRAEAGGHRHAPPTARTHGDDRDASSRCVVSLVQVLVQGARALTSKDGRREIFAARDMQM